MPLTYLTAQQWSKGLSQTANALIIDDETFWVQNGQKDWSITGPAANVVRFEVRAGDHWAGDADTRQRSEISDRTDIRNGAATHVSYSFAVEPGARNTAAWMVLGQFHQDEANAIAGNSPPFAVNLVGERMAISIGYTDAAGRNVSQRVYTDAADIVRGHEYGMDIQVTFDPSGLGHLSVVRDGKVLVDYTGKLGYVGQASVYWKEGIYRAPADETIAVDYRNLAIDTVVAPRSAPAELAATSGSVSRQYDSSGDLVRQTTTMADNSKSVLVFKIAGQTYTAEASQLDAAGKLLSLVRSHADGSLDSTQTLNGDGSTTYARYDAAGTMTQQATAYTDGTLTTRVYAGGTLSTVSVAHPDGSRDLDLFNVVGKSYTSGHITYDKAGRITYNITQSTDGSSSATWRDDGVTISRTVVTRADGSSTTSTFGITGQTYVSQTKVVDASGALVSLSRAHADGTKDYWQGVAADGTTTTQLFDAAGKMVRQTVEKTDGSRVVDSWGVTGQSYTTQHVVYDKAGVATALSQYHADGTRDYALALGQDGTSTASKYDLAGKLAVTAVTKADGASLSKWYDAAGKVTLSIDKATDGSSVTKQFDAAGKLVKETDLHADGSRDVDAFGITGQSYTSQHAVYDKDGAQLSLVRLHADGTKDFVQTLNADRSTTASTYDAAGKLAVQKVTGADGSALAKTYDAKGTVIGTTDTHTDGSYDVYQYAVTGKSYGSAHFSYDAGKQLDWAETFNTDGTHTVTLADTGITVAATAAKDIFVAYGGDTFAFGTGSGHDVISNFHAGAGQNHDTISLAKSLVPDFAHLSLKQAGADTILTLSDHDTITLKGVQLAALTHHDFLFI